SILTSSPFEKLQRTTESQKALQDSGIFSLHLNVQPRRTKQSSLTDSPLKSSRQKVDFSKILRAKQVNIYKQNKNRFLKSVTSCLIHQSSVEIPKKQVSSKTILNSKISNSVVEKASNKAHILGDQSPSIIVNAPDCDNSVNNRLKLQWDVKEKIMNMKHRKSEVDLVVTKVDEPIPSLPHFKLHKDTIDGLFSNNVKRTIRHMSHEEKDRRKPWEMKGIMDHNITLKAENASLLSVLSGKELPLLLHSIKQESKVQEGKGKSERNLTDSYTSLSSLSQVNLHSRTEVGKDKPRILRSCLLEQKSQVSSNVKRVSSAEPADRETLCNALEPTCLLQKREKSGENIVDIKDIMDLICFSLKCENSPFKQILHGRKPEWDNKKQEDTKKKDKSKLGIVQNKSWNSILPSPQVEWDVRMKQGVAQLCLPPPTLQELSEATCKEPTDDNLSSIKRAKYTTKKYRMQTGEITPSERMFSMTKQSSVPQELQMNVEKKEKKTQEDKQVETEEKSSISFPPCSARKKGEEALQIKERSSFLHPKLKESPQRGKIAHEKFISDAICYSIKNTIDHILQKEESEKMESIITLKKNKSVLQNIQLDIKQEEEELQKIKDEPTVDNTTISVPSPSHVTLDSGMEKAHCIMEVIRCSLLELLQQKSSDAVRKMSRESTEGNIRMSTQKTKEHMPEKEENKIKALAKENILHPKDKDLKENKTLSQGLSLTLAEDGETDQPSNEKKQTARESKKQEKWDHDGKKQGKTDSQGKQEGNMDGKTNEQGKMDPEGQEQEEINGECKELEKIGVDDKEQGKRDQQRKERGEMGLEDQDQEQEQEQEKPLGGEGKEQGKVYPERTEQKKVERKAEEHERVDGERKEQEKRDEEDQQQGEWDQQVTSQLATRAEDEDEGGGGEGGGEEGRGET
ncbi:glutamic acid-rich protein-like, partial [Fukomys damarensis]|uniref:glutamic acid-rich protein-like n=1 Tax=Fukomys damarensis TaxID=885580 RepID=UPI0008FED34B